MLIRRIGHFFQIALLVFAVNCFILAALFQIQAIKEKDFLHGIAHCWRNRSIDSFSHLNNTEEAVALALMHSVHLRMNSRENNICGTSLGNPRSVFRWVSEDVNDPGGACGGYSNVLGRLLMELGYDVRKIGLEKGKVLSNHQVIEVKLNGHWVVLDPWFNLVFRKPDGSFAGASDLSRNWKYYSQQTPDQYSPDYDYQAYHYTNWKRLGLFGRLLQKIFDSDAPDRRFSVFRYLVNKDQYLPYFLSIIGIVMLAINLTIHFYMSRSRTP